MLIMPVNALESSSYLSSMSSLPSLSTLSSSRAWEYFSERGEDALYAVKGVLGGTGSSKYLDMREENVAKIHSQLESIHEAERLEGMKSIVAMISKGRDASPYLASVFKLSSSTSLEVRKLVYLVVLRYAKSHQDLALLSINSFQRDLADPNPLIRGMALRTLSGIHLREVSELVMMAVNKASRDPHPYVRRIAAYALPTCYNLDHGNYERLVECLKTFFCDRSPSVLGAATSIFQNLCPDRWDLLHRHFRKLCYALGDMSEWAQPTCMLVLTRYSRANISKPSSTHVDPDLQVLLTSLSAQTASMNPAVVVSVVRAFSALFPERLSTVFPALIRLLRSPPDVSYVVVLHAIELLRSSFVDISPYLTAFYVRASDPAYLALAKLHVLVHSASASQAPDLAHELATYTRSSCITVALRSVTALGQLASRHEGVALQSLHLLVDVTQVPTLSTPVLSRAVHVVQSLLHTCSPSTAAVVVVRFALRLFVPLANRVRDPDAPRIRILTDTVSRVAVLWMVGLHLKTCLAGSSLLELIVPDLLRCLVAHWSKEQASVQCQALTLSAKAFVHGITLSDSALRMALTVLHYEILARASMSSDTDVRDRARFYGGLTRGLADSESELDTAPNEDVRSYLASHHNQDLLRLPGVRLRLAQVQHVLVSHEDESVGDTCLREQRSKTVFDRALFFDLDSDVLKMNLRGSKDAQLPEWCDPDALPPSIVRLPDSHSVQPKDNWAQDQRSFSNDTFFNHPSMASKVVLEPRDKQSWSSTTTQGQARFTDLDSFLEAPSESDDDDYVENGMRNSSTSIDRPAPEDDEYAYDSSDLDSDEAVAMIK